MPARGVERPHEDPIQSEVGDDHEPARRIGADHVRVRHVVTADGEAARRGMRGAFRTDDARRLLDVGRGPEPAVREDGEHGHRAACVIGDQQVTAAAMHARVCRSGPAGGDAVHQLQLSRGPIHGERADGARGAVVDDVGGVGRIEVRARRVEDEGAGARVVLGDACSRQRARGAIDPEDVDASTVAGRKVDLARRRVHGRRTVGADVREEAAARGRRLACRAAANAGATDARPVAAVTNERRVSVRVVRVLLAAGRMGADPNA